MIFHLCKNNILIFSQMRLQLYQSHSFTAKGLKSGQKSINWFSLAIIEISRFLSYRVHKLNIWKWCDVGETIISLTFILGYKEIDMDRVLEFYNPLRYIINLFSYALSLMKMKK